MLIGFFLKYKGYQGSIEYDAEDNLYYGRLQGIRDLVNYHANSIVDLNMQYKLAVDDYIELKQELGFEK